MRTTPEESVRQAKWIAERLNRCQGEVRFLMPTGGVSALDAPGQAFWDPVADKALFDTLEAELRQTARQTLAAIRTHLATLLLAVATLMAAGILAIVALHVLTD